MRFSFRDAVLATSTLAGSYCDGLQALMERDRNRIACDSPRQLRGSVNLEEALRPQHPDDPVWDYAIGAAKTEDSDRVIWVEVHPATAGEVDRVLRKYEWLKDWRATSAPRLHLAPRDHVENVWIASGSVSLTRHSPQMKRLVAAGIRFVGRRLVV